MNLLSFLFIGTPEIFVILLIVVMLFGAKKIPELARGLGKGMREFKNATSDIQEEIRKSSDEITKNVKMDSKPQSRKQEEDKEQKS